MFCNNEVMVGLWYCAALEIYKCILVSMWDMIPRCSSTSERAAKSVQSQSNLQLILKNIFPHYFPSAAVMFSSKPAPCLLLSEYSGTKTKHGKCSLVHVITVWCRHLVAFCAITKPEQNNNSVIGEGINICAITKYLLPMPTTSHIIWCTYWYIHIYFTLYGAL